ncbi:MAG: cation:proton antiporter [Rubrobacteraceae bacterium]
MGDEILVGLAAVVILGIGAQLLAWRIGLPSILLLLLFGFAVGPVTGFVDPEELLGDTLSPLVSLFVGIILFRGGLGLDIGELRGIRRPVFSLVSIGVAVTWASSAVAAFFLLDLDPALAVLLGAILVVSGPTVVTPLLRQVRPTRRVESTLQWEGILVDPVGAILAILVFEVIQSGGFQAMSVPVLLDLGLHVLAGVVVGALGAAIMVLRLKRYSVPEFLQNQVTLAVVVAAFTVANILEEESGLLAVTVMGIILANQRLVSVRHLEDFQDKLEILLISVIFILLSAQPKLSDLLGVLNPSSLLFLALLILVVRPVAVALSTIRTQLNWRERAFVAWIAPRGIVAAAISSTFALQLSGETGSTGAARLVPLAFLVIVGTVLVYSLSAKPVARWLGLTRPEPRRVLILGAHDWAYRLAKALREAGQPVLLWAYGPERAATVKEDDLPLYEGSILLEEPEREPELEDVSVVLALTPYDEFNSLASMRFIETHGRASVYQLVPEPAYAGDEDHQASLPGDVHGRLLFGEDLTFTRLSELFENGAKIERSELPGRNGYEKEGYIPLFLVDETGKLTMFATDHHPTPRPNQTVAYLSVPGHDTRKDRDL